MTIERDELSLELRLRRMSQQPDGACDCEHADKDVKRHPWDHSTNCRWRILVEAADDCAEAVDLATLTDRLDQLLRATVNTMRGDPPPLVHWSHHDIPDLAKLYRAVYAAAVQVIAVSGWQGEAGTPGYKAFDALVKAADALSAEIKRDFDAVRTVLKEGGEA